MMVSSGKKRNPKTPLVLPIPEATDNIDAARASKDGHRYHEAWVSRRSLELIFPRDNLSAIAVEGLHDEKGMSQEAIEIADATFYYGHINFDKATAIQVEQFKYSVARENEPFRASDAKKTLEKFAAADSDFSSKHGASATEAKVRFGISTNRPIFPSLVEAIRAAAADIAPKSAEAKTQLKQIEAATGLNGSKLRSLCQRLEVAGHGDTVAQIEGRNRKTIADWSASSDLHVRARIGDLRELIRNKAGISGQTNKTIFKEDVLAALGVGDETDFFPTPDAFPPVGEIVEREQLIEFLSKIDANPLSLVHAAGGIGKTVFVQSIASRLGAQNEVVLFDCFGGGAYRVPVDGRHRPERGLIHIVNELAARGLCDPILPTSQDSAEIVRTAIKRFSQAVLVLQRSRPTARLIIILDAIDNAGLEADDRGQPSFPRELFETFAHTGLKPGVILIGTCRSERIAKAVGRAGCFQYPLKCFSIAETTRFVLARRSDATTEQIASLQHRSAGNPRIIFNLIESSKPLSAADEQAIADLDSLIQERIDGSVKLALQKSADTDAINGFLCALALLPPPVPLDELANAFGQPTSAMESFASDLSPLLDRTRHGLIFRDEPTETLVRNRYGGLVSLLTDVVKRLGDAQGTSPYAARSLPGLLFAIGDVAGLTTLAFDERFPPTLTSEIAKRAIRLNRLRVAVAAATRANDADAMTALLVELSSVAVVHERGDDYFLKNPDLVMTLGDAEATRRLYESRRGWFGARPSRLAIAYTLEGDLGEAHDHARSSVGWLRWLNSEREDRRFDIRPEIDDFAAWAFYLMEADQLSQAVGFLAWWAPWHGFKVSKRLLELDQISRVLGNAKFKDGSALKLAMRTDCPAPYIAAFLESSHSVSKSDRENLIRKLASKIKTRDKIQREINFHDDSYSYREGILSASLEAYSNGLLDESKKLLGATDVGRFSFYSIRDHVSPENLSPNFLTIALNCALNGKAPTLFDCLPREIVDLVKGKPCPATQAEQEKVVIDAINEAAKQGPDPNVKPLISGSDRYEWTDRLHTKLSPIIMITTAVYRLLVARTSPKKQAALKEYFTTWEEARAFSRKSNYGGDRELGHIDQFFLNTYFDLTVSFRIVQLDFAQLLQERLRDLKFKPPHMLIAFVERFAASSASASVAGELATEIAASIEQMDDTQERSSNYAALARALLRADRIEAALLFGKGYSELTAIGSGDYELAREFLSFACQLERAPLDALSAHTLGKIVELSTPYESEKFPWALAAQGFCNAWNFDYLAQLARWDDRDKIALEYTIGPAVTRFVEKNRLSPREGAVLLALVDPVETWEWRIEHFFEVALKATPKDNLTTADEYLDLLERIYPASVPERELTTFETVLGANDQDVLKAVRSRVAAMRKKCHPERSYSSSDSGISPEQRRKAKQEEARELRTVKASALKIKAVSVDDFEKLVEQIDGIHGRLDLKTQAFAQIRDGLHYSKRQAYATAIVETRNLELFAKLALLKDARAAWHKNSPSKLAFFRGFGLRLVELHADEILTKNWGFASTLDDVAELSGDSKVDIAVKLANLAALKELKADATAWLSLGEIISQNAKPAVPRDALKRILSGEAARLAEDVGDGKWDVVFEAPKESAKVVAGLIWYSLSSPDTVVRWQAAHAVRRSAKLKLWEVVDELFTLFQTGRPGAFRDRKLPFFQMHAQLWFLLAIARCALDCPAEVAKYRSIFEKLLQETDLPHPVMQDVAAKALVATFGKSAIPAKIRKLLGQTNRSPFPISSKQKSEFPYQRPKDMPGSDFHSDYDFNKHNVSSLGHMFLLPDWKVTDDMVTTIRLWDKDVKSMHDFCGKREPPGRSHYRQVNDRFQSYGLYIGWHALMIVGGKYLRQRPIHKRYSDDDAWEDWLRHYTLTRNDGLWPSDGTDRYPGIAGVFLCEGSGKVARPKDDIDMLASLAGVVGGKLGSSLSVEGSWKSPDSVNVRVSSALIPPGKASDAALAVATAPLHHAWLPVYRYEDEEDEMRGALMAPIEPWLWSPERYEQFDQYDPFRSSRAFERCRPAKSIAERFELNPDPVWFRDWKMQSGKVALSAEAWGARTGQGEREDWDAGRRLVADTKFLGKLLTTLNRELIVLVSLEHYKDRDEYGRDLGDGERFTHSTLVMLISKSLEVRFIEALPEHSKIINKLSLHDRSEFENRLKALLRAKRPRKGGVAR